jgi:hypothetical protein
VCEARKTQGDWSMFDEDGAIPEMILALNKILSLAGFSDNYSHIYLKSIIYVMSNNSLHRSLAGRSP